MLMFFCGRAVIYNTSLGRAENMRTLTMKLNSVVETVQTTRELTKKEIKDIESGKLSIYELDCIDWDTLDRIDSDLDGVEVDE